MTLNTRHNLNFNKSDFGCMLVVFLLVVFFINDHVFSLTLSVAQLNAGLITAFDKLSKHGAVAGSIFLEQPESCLHTLKWPYFQTYSNIYLYTFVYRINDKGECTNPCRGADLVGQDSI